MFSIIRRLFNKFRRKYREIKIWREHRDLTWYHLNNDGDIIVDGTETHGVPLIHKYDKECTLHIGRYCSIAAGCQIILGGNHHIKWASTYAFYKEQQIFTAFSGLGEAVSMNHGNITIGNDVWMGRNVTILPGTNIGHGAVIGAGSVVAGNIPPYCIAVGNPCRVVRSRFSESQVKQLLEIAWWNWPHEKINEKLHLICSEDIDAFINDSLADIQANGGGK